MVNGGWGSRLKARARELGLSDAAVARALGMAQRRYSAYANETREPDFATLARICRILRTSPDAILGFTPQEAPRPDEGAAARAAAALAAMTGPDLERAAVVLESLAQHAEATRPVEGFGEGSDVRREGGRHRN